MTPMPIFIPISNSGGGGTVEQNVEIFIVTTLLAILAVQYVIWFLRLVDDDYESRKDALLHVIPFSIIIVVIAFIFDKIRDLD